MCDSHKHASDGQPARRSCTGECRGGTSANCPNRRFSDQPANQPANQADTPPITGSVVDRRMGIDRRDLAEYAQQHGAAGADDYTGLERRRGPGRRRTDFTKSAEEGEMTGEQFLFISAIEAFKKSNNKMFPTWTDVLEVVRLLGYRKTMPSELNLRNVEDWRERSDTPHGVRTKPGHPEERRDAA